MDYQILRKENINSIYVYPLIEKNEAFAYVTVSNPSDNLTNQNLTDENNELTKKYDTTEATV